MPRRCLVCTSEHRAEIDAKLVAGMTFAELSRQYGMGRDSLRAHRNNHLKELLQQAKEREQAAHAAVQEQFAAEVARGDSLLEQVQSLQTRALAILATAEESGSLSAATAP